MYSPVPPPEGAFERAPIPLLTFQVLLNERRSWTKMHSCIQRPGNPGSPPPRLQAASLNEGSTLSLLFFLVTRGYLLIQWHHFGRAALAANAFLTTELFPPRGGLYTLPPNPERSPFPFPKRECSFSRIVVSPATRMESPPCEYSGEWVFFFN